MRRLPLRRRRLATVVPGVLAALVPLSPAAASDAPTCALIGDSNVARMGLAPFKSELLARGKCAGGLYFYGVGGKELLKADHTGKTTLQNIADARAALGHVDYWMFALGTNSLYLADADYAAAVREVSKAAGAHVDWIDVAFYNSANVKAQRKNPVLAGVCAEMPGVTYHGWNGWIHDPSRFEASDWLAPKDVTHMTAQGYAKRAAYMAEVLGAPAMAPAR